MAKHCEEPRNCFLFCFVWKVQPFIFFSSSAIEILPKRIPKSNESLFTAYSNPQQLPKASTKHYCPWSCHAAVKRLPCFLLFCTVGFPSFGAEAWQNGVPSQVPFFCTTQKKITDRLYYRRTVCCTENYKQK